MNDRQTRSRSALRSTRTRLTSRIRLAAALAATCVLAAGPATAEDSGPAPADVAAALRALPQVEVVQTTADGVPLFMRGDLGRAPRLDANNLAAAEQAMRDLLAPALAPLRLQAVDLRLRKINDGEHGNQHLRYVQTHRGLDVVGGDLVVHVDKQGRIFAINGTARGDIPAALGRKKISESAVHALTVRDKRFTGMATTAPRTVFLLSPEGVFSMAFETEATGTRGAAPVRDKVYIDVDSGAVLAVHPQIHFALNRQVFNASNTTTAGTLARTEGGAASGDADVDAAYEGTGATYQAYKAFWNRDSYDNAGAPLISKVHYGARYCNAFWDGHRLVYGNGNTNLRCQSLARGQDITAHELTHAVTANESRLIGDGEAGGLNEAMSDIFGAFTEAYVDGGKTGVLAVSANTWKIGQAVLPASNVRTMNNPSARGGLDFYEGGVYGVDAHDSAGIANLAFYLMSQGGRHPRNKSTIDVAPIGMAKAIRVFYEANVNILTSQATFLAAAQATVQAARNLGYSAAVIASVGNAWQAVGVPVLGPVALRDGWPMNVQGATGTQRVYAITVPQGAPFVKFTTAGGTEMNSNASSGVLKGNVDMYVSADRSSSPSTPGPMPSPTYFECRSVRGNNLDTCVIKAPRAGVYNVMLNAKAGYSDVTLIGSYEYDEVVPLSLGTAVGSTASVTVHGAAGSTQEFLVTVPNGRALRVALSGGAGQANVYIRKVRPMAATDPYLCGTVSGTRGCGVSSGGSFYIMVQGYSEFTGMTLTARVEVPGNTEPTRPPFGYNIWD